MSKQQRDAIDAALRAEPFDLGQSTAEHRKSFDTWAIRPYPPDVVAAGVTLGGVGAIELTVAGNAADPALLYFHGGGYVAGSARAGAHLAAELARRTGGRALSVDYRLAPEHPYPAAVQDGLAAYAGLLESGASPSRVLVAGDSAGGGLAVATLLAAREQGLPQPAAVAVFSPWADISRSGASMRTKDGTDPLFSYDAMGWYAGRYLPAGDRSAPLPRPAAPGLTGQGPDSGPRTSGGTGTGTGTGTGGAGTGTGGAGTGTSGAVAPVGTGAGSAPDPGTSAAVPAGPPVAVPGSPSAPSTPGSAPDPAPTSAPAPGSGPVSAPGTPPAFTPAPVSVSVPVSVSAPAGSSVEVSASAAPSVAVSGSDLPSGSGAVPVSVSAAAGSSVAVAASAAPSVAVSASGLPSVSAAVPVSVSAAAPGAASGPVGVAASVTPSVTVAVPASAYTSAPLAASASAGVSASVGRIASVSANVSVSVPTSPGK